VFDRAVQPRTEVLEPDLFFLLTTMSTVDDSSVRAARNLLTGTATKYVLLAVNIVTGILLMPFTIEHLGKAQYGLWMLIASMTYYFQLLDLGYGSGIVRHITEADARGDERAVNEVVSTFVVVYIAVGGVALAGTVLLAALVVPRMGTIGTEHLATAQAVMLILGLRVAVGLPMTVFGAIVNSRQAFAINGVIAIVSSLVSALVTYIVLITGHGLIPLVAATTTVALVTYLAYAASARRVFPALRIRVAMFSRTRVREVTAFSAYVFLIHIAIQLGFNMSTLVIGTALGTSAVAVYAVCFRLTDYQRQLCNQLNGLLFPVIVRFATEDPARLRSAAIETTRVAFGLVAAVTVALIGFGGLLIPAWMGPGFERAVIPLYILAIASVILVVQQPLGNVLMGGGGHRFVAFVALGEALANLLLSLLLVRSLGLIGVALGMAVPVLVANLGLLMPTACRRLQLPYWRFLVDTARPATIAAIPAAACIAAVRSVVIAPTFLEVVALAAGTTAVYAVAFLTIGLPGGVRDRYIAYARDMWRRPAAVGAA
jgi:O-antigen/teichoic acid export membrane protein